MLNPPNTDPTQIQPATPDPTQDANNRDRQQRGTGFTNINRILTANDGAGQKIGQAIGSGIDKQAASVRDGIQQGQKQFQAGLDQSKGAAQSTISQGQALQKQAGEDNNAYSTRLAQNNGTDYSKIGQNVRAADYNGPMNLQNADALKAQAATTGALGRLAGSSAGQSELLRRTVAQRGNYTNGQNSLDQLLIGRDGQNAIQQARTNTNGLTDQLGSTIQNARNQASATQGSIANQRNDTLNNLNNQLIGTGGFTDTAKTNAQTFQNDATDLSKIFSGNYAGTTADDRTKASGLLDRLGDFGLDNASLYDKNDAAVKGALGNLSGSLTKNFGTSKYSANESQAAQNLASFLGQDSLKSQIANNNFNTNVFGQANDYHAGLDQARGTDQESKRILQDASGSIKGVEQGVIGRNNQQYADVIKNINDSGSPEEDKAYYRQQAADGLQNSNNSVPGRQYVPAYVNEGVYSDGHPLTATYNNGSSVRAETDPSVANKFAPYGFLAYGDHGENDIDSRFKGLGLNAENNVSGQYRSTGALDSAAQKVLGQDQSVKEFALRKMLGQQQILDPSASGPKTVTQNKG